MEEPDSHGRLNLQSQDLHNVCQSLMNMERNHIIELGLELGLFYPTLQKMNNLPTEMVAAWLNRQDDVLQQSGEPTWRRLADALEKIGQTGVAQDILSKCHGSSNAADAQLGISGPSQSRLDSGTDTSGIIKGDFSAEIQEDLRQRIHTDVSKIKRSFSRLQAIARENIKNHKKLIAHVMGMDILSEEDVQEVKMASNTDEVFIVLAKYWSFLDYGNLEDIIENNCGEAEWTKMQEYGKDVKKFCEKRVSEFPLDSLHNDISRVGMEELHFVLDLTNPSLKRIKDLKRVIATILGHEASKLVLVSIGGGSIVATFLTTASTAKQICSLTKKQEDALKIVQVTSLKFRSRLIFGTQVKAEIPLSQSLEIEPSPRFWHHTFSCNGNIFIRGGSISNFESEKNQLATKLSQFNLIDKKWQHKDTKGAPHPGLTQIACVYVNDVLYTYGSDDRKVLSQLDGKEFVWSQLWSTSENDDGSTPMIKASAGIAYFANGHLAVFGGYACPSGPIQPGSAFVPNPFEKNKGWTNEFHIFHISKKCWLSPIINGTRPPACADFTLNSIYDLRAILFGGYQPRGSRDELYIIDFDVLRTEITFCKVEKTNNIWPEGRECPSGCCLGLNTSHPQLLISGGKNRYDTPLKFDMWMLDLKSFEWKKVQLPPGKRSPRWGHSMTSVTTPSGLEAVVIFGGSSGKFGSDWNSPTFSRLAETVIYYFGNHGSEWTLLYVEERMGGKSNTSVLEWTQFELNNQLSMKTIFAMEKEYRVPLLSELTKKQSEFQEEIQVSTKSGIVSLIAQWLKSSGDIKKKPTWQNLFHVLQRINLGPLAWRMIDCILRAMIDATEALENDLMSYSYASLGEEDILRQKIQSFVSHSNVTISILKHKYDNLRIDVDDLLNSPTTEPSVTYLSEDEEDIEVITTEPTVKSEPKDKSTDKVATKPSQAQQGGKEGILIPNWEDPNDIKIRWLKKENEELRDRLDKLQHLLSGLGKAEVTAQAQSNGFELPGVDVLGETTFVVTNNAEVFKWEEYGLELCVHENVLPKGTEKCKISIKASIAGQYQFPENYSLVSAVFWLCCEPVCKFSKAITMKMEHCVKSKNAPSKLSFVRTFCIQKKLPYTFEKIGGSFTKADGTIELRGFSGLGIAAKEPGEQEYCARIFYLRQPRVTSYEIDFVVTWNIKAHHAAVKEEYKDKDAKLGIEQTFFFELDSIIIDIPLKGIKIKGGWKIIPLTNPVVLKQIVDNYEEGKVIPKCQFSAKAIISDGEQVPPLLHQATLRGAKYPNNIITFNLTPPLVTFESSHASRKRPASTSDATPVAKKTRTRKSKLLDLSISTISEDTSVDDIPPSNSTQTGPMQHELDENNLHDIMDEVISISAKYYALGLALRLRPGDLDRVRRENHLSTQDALSDVLLLWLRRTYDVENYGPPTWQMLVEAVRKESGGNNRALADKIAEKQLLLIRQQ